MEELRFDGDRNLLELINELIELYGEGYRTVFLKTETLEIPMDDADGSFCTEESALLELHI